MRKIFLTAFILALATPAWAAQQNISTITTKQSREELRGAINTELGKVQSNTTELYSIAIAAPWLAQATAPSITNVFWVDTSGASPVIKYYDGDSWEVAAAGDGGTYTLPTASTETKGGIIVGDRLSIDANGVLSADVQSGTGAVDSVNSQTGTVVLDADDISDASTTNKFVTSAQLGLLDGANQLELAGPNVGTNGPTYIQGGAVTNLSGLLLRGPVDLPSSGTELMTLNLAAANVGQIGRIPYSTFATPTGSAASMTIDASGFNGNLATTDNTIQEIAQKVDDLVIGAGGYTNLTEFLGQTAWRLFYSDGSGDVTELPLGSDGEYLKSNGAALAPSWATPSGAAHDAVTLDTSLASNLLGLSTQQLTLDSQTANYIFAAPNGSAGVPSFRALVAADVPALAATGINITDSGNYFTGTNVETVLQELGAFPTLAFGAGLTAAVDTPSAGTTTVSVTTNTYQAYDADLTTWAGVTPGTGVTTALAVNSDTVGGMPTIIAKGAYTVDTAKIAANTCSSAVAVTATGVATTDTIIATPNAILSTVAGFGVTATGAVRVDVYPTSGNVNFQFCNPTGTAIDPGSVTFNWKVLR